MSSEQTNPWRRQPPVLKLSLRLQLPITPVSSNHGCDESRQTPIRIKRAAMNLPVALAAAPLQKNVGAATRPMGSSQTRGCRFHGANPLVAFATVNRANRVIFRPSAAWLRPAVVSMLISPGQAQCDRLDKAGKFHKKSPLGLPPAGIVSAAPRQFPRDHEQRLP